MNQVIEKTHPLAPSSRSSTLKPKALHVVASGQVIPIPREEKHLYIGTGPDAHIRLKDPYVSRLHCQLKWSRNQLFIEDLQSKNGTYLNGHLIAKAPALSGSHLQVGKTTLAFIRTPPASESLIVGTHPSIQKVKSLIRAAAQTDCSVFILGETGTGKELVARRIHQLSQRKEQPFVPVNCGAIPKDLVSSALFGYQKGAFTGAQHDKPGHFSAADGGTLFLDELGEMPLSQQPHLLRALETGHIRPVGSPHSVAVDVRVVAATHQIVSPTDINTALRPDLFHRLATIIIEVPPLRERRSDIPTLIEHFARQLSRKYGRRHLPGKLVAELCSLEWKGNVRELKQTLERGFVTTRPNEKLTHDHLVPALFSRPKTQVYFTSDGNTAHSELSPIDALVCDQMVQEIKRQGSMRGAARALGMPKSTFFEKARRYGIKRFPTHKKK